jgi:hypothetical protein
MLSLRNHGESYTGKMFLTFKVEAFKKENVPKNQQFLFFE